MTASRVADVVKEYFLPGSYVLPVSVFFQQRKVIPGYSGKSGGIVTVGDEPVTRILSGTSPYSDTNEIVLTTVRRASDE